MLQRKSSLSSNNISNRSRRQFLSYLNLGKPLAKITFTLVLIGILLSFGIKSLTINKINCTVNNKTCPEEVNEMLQPLLNKEFFKISKNELHWSIGQVFPFKELRLSFIYPHTLDIKISGNQEFFLINSYQVSELPHLSFDTFGSSSDSAQWSRPVSEISKYLSQKDSAVGKLWESGLIVPAFSSETSKISYIYTNASTPDHMLVAYKIISLIHKYLDHPQIYILNNRLFVGQENMPDIIINTDSSLSRLETSLQSLNFLVTIKKDVRVLNLSFEHPIIK